MCDIIISISHFVADSQRSYLIRRVLYSGGLRTGKGERYGGIHVYKNVCVLYSRSNARE